MNATAPPVAVPTTVPPARRDARGRDRWRWAAFGFVIVLVVVAQGHNMLHYPYIEADEGTYASQAWAVFHMWRLSPYTYFYDHPPLGWIQIAIWQLLAGDHGFGYALASARVFMLLLQIGSACLVLAIGRRCSGKVWVGLLAASVFTLSTYGLFHHRRILLDNVATLWLLISLFFLLRPVTLRRIWLSALAIGIAVLSKEVAVVAIPALVVLVVRESPASSRRFAVTSFLAIALSVCSLYVLAALLKGEFFPAGTPLGGERPHVSLLCSLLWQGSRGRDGGILDPSSAFWVAFRSWAHSEPLLTIGGTAAAGIAVVLLRRDAHVSAIGWIIFSVLLFFGRGGIVLAIYLVPLLPLLGLSIAFVLHAVAVRIRRSTPRFGVPASAAVVVGGVVLCGFSLWVGYERSDGQMWTGDPVAAQIQAVHWIDRHLPPSSRIVIDQSMWLDLHDPSHGEPTYPDAEYYWKVGDDPQVRDRVFDGDWRNVQYVVTTPQLVSDTMKQAFPVVAPALAHSVPVIAFDTGGWRLEVRRVDPSASPQLNVPSVRSPDVPKCMTYKG